MRSLVAVGAGLVAVPFLLAGAVAVMLTETPEAEAACGSATTAADAIRLAVDGGKGGVVRVPGLAKPSVQVPNARIVQRVGNAMGIPPRGQVIALATALTESGLENKPYGDRDSLGLFQQRPSQGWGTAAQILDPVYASTQFYRHLVKVHGWQMMPLALAAQAVQASGRPNAYAAYEPLATALQRALAKDGGRLGTSKGDTGSGAAGCAEDGSQFGVIPAGALPKGYMVPTDAPAEVRTAITWALRQLGTHYQWGGWCTNPHGFDPQGWCDCSSLMQAAYAKAGVRLPRTTYDQVKAGRAVSVEHLKLGDLLFTRGTAARPEHVGMYIGSGLIINAPRTGDVVRIAPLADWKPRVLAARRIVAR